MYDEVMMIGNTRRNLKEKARPDEAGGKIADGLARRVKELAEEDGVPHI